VLHGHYPVQLEWVRQIEDERSDLEQRDRGQVFKRLALALDRIELLAVALHAFAQPVPNYEPRLDPRFVKILRRRVS
jgi:hypothetical protein